MAERFHYNDVWSSKELEAIYILNMRKTVYRLWDINATEYYLSLSF